MGKRLISLDVVRGMTVAGMIVVNNGFRDSFMMLRHAEWNGLSFSDLVFPFFLFIMGVSIYLSFYSRNFKPESSVWLKVAKRTILLFAIGLGINWFDMAVGGGWLDFGELRFWAVLQRIALCYFLVSAFAISFNHRLTIPLALLLLIAYSAIILLGNGYSTDKDTNLLHIIDARIFGETHLYHKSAVDPEGFLGTIPALANVLFGFWCGMKIKLSEGMNEKIIAVFRGGALMAFAGFLVNFALPLNKRIWSPSFALVTSGMCALLLALTMLDTDKNGNSGKWVSFFRVFGSNALFLYILSELLAITFGELGVNKLMFDLWTAIIPVSQLASLAYALTYLAVCFLPGLILYRRKIFIEL